MKTKIMIILLLILTMAVFGSCLFRPDSEDTGDTGDTGDAGGEPDNGGIKYNITIGFDAVVSSQLSLAELPDEIKLKIVGAELFSGNEKVTLNLEKPIDIDLMVLLEQELTDFIAITMKEDGIYDKIRFILSGDENENYIRFGSEIFIISLYSRSKQKSEETTKHKVILPNLYFDVAINPKMKVSDCKNNFINTTFDLKRAFVKMGDIYQINNSGIYLNYSCIPIETGFDYQILMGFNANITSDYVNPPSNIILKIIGMDLINEYGAYRYNYAQPQTIDLIDALLDHNVEVSPLIVKSGIYDKIKVLLAPETDANYVVINEKPYPILSEAGELFLEFDINGSLNLVDCQKTYITVNIDVRKILIEQDKEFFLHSEGVTSENNCTLIVSDNKVLMADGKITGFSEMSSGPVTELKTYKTYSKVIDGLLYTRTDYNSKSELDIPTTIISNGCRTQVINTKTNEIISDTDIEDKKMGIKNIEKIKNALVKDKLSLCQLYNMENFIENYKEQGYNETKESNGDIVSLRSNFSMKDGKNGSIKVMVNKRRGTIEQIETTSQISMKNKDVPVNVLMTNEYTYYGDFLYLKRKTTVSSLKLSMNDMINSDYLNNQSIKKYKNFDFDKVKEITEEEYNANKSKYTLVPEMEKVRKVSDANTEMTLTSYSWEEISNIMLILLDDKFFMFR